MKVKIYADGADKASMLALAKDPKIQGLTTNPSLMRKAGITNYKNFSKEILLEIKDKPISFEVFAADFAGMEKQAQEINSWGENVYVKIPVMNSAGESSTKLINKLSHAGVKLNVTAIFTVDQCLETCQALKSGAPAIVSVFAGRIADSGRDPIPLMEKCLEICQEHGEQMELLWASTREPYNIIQADLIGCHIITVPPDIIKKLSGFGKDPKALSLETIKTFEVDAQSCGFTI